MNKKTEQTHPEVGEDATKYGEFVSSYFAWIPLPEQKERAKEMVDMTNNGKRNKKEPTPNEQEQKRTDPKCSRSGGKNDI